jgi:hypothetical protein
MVVGPVIRPWVRLCALRALRDRGAAVHDGGSARPGDGHAMRDEREVLGLALNKLDAERLRALELRVALDYAHERAATLQARTDEATAYLETLTRSPLRDRVLAILRGEE